MERRARFRQGLSSLYLPYYDALCGVLPPPWQPYAGLRTMDEQARIWAQGRSSPGKIVTNAGAGESAHNYGCASDWTVFDDHGNPVWMVASDPRWKEYQDALEKVQLRWGGDWNGNGRQDDEHFIDDPHNELVIACSWRHVAQVLAQNGMRAAQEKIEEAHSK